MPNEDDFSVQSWTAQLAVAAKILAIGGLQKDVRKTFGDTRGQKLFYILTLDRLFPAIGLARLDDRKIASLNFVELINLGHRANPDQLKQLNSRATIAGRPPVEALTEEELRTWLDVRPVINRPKIMSRENIEQLVLIFPNKTVQMTARAILENNFDLLQTFAEKPKRGKKK